MTRIHTTPPYLSISDFTRQNANDQARATAHLNAEVSSGGTYADYGTVRDIKLFLDHEIELVQERSYDEANIYNTQRLSRIIVQLETLEEMASELQEEISLLRSSSLASLENFQDRARNMLTHVNSILNESFNGEYLFSGTAITTPSTANLTTLPPPDTGDPVLTDYYRGNSEFITYYAHNLTEITTEVTAASPGIAGLVHALRLSITTTHNNDMPLRLQKAYDVCQEASSDIITDTSKVRIHLQRIEKIRDVNAENQVTLSQDIQELGYRSPNDIFQDLMQRQMLLQLSNTMSILSHNITRDLLDRLA